MNPSLIPGGNGESHCKQLDTLVLGLTSGCNLRCEYCHNAIYYDTYDQLVSMPVDLALKAIRDYANYVLLSGSQHAVVCLTGGEPLLRGKDYLTELLKGIDHIQEDSHLAIHRDLVTNATLLTVDHCKIFTDYGVNVSVSVDGPAYLTDRHRKPRAADHLTADRIRESMELLHSNKIPFGVLATVTSTAVGHEREMLKYFQSVEPAVISFNPCVDKGPLLKVSDYSRFLVRLFDEWVDSGKYFPAIRTFRYFFHQMSGRLGMDIPCEWNNDCPNTISISADGKVWVCEMYMGCSDGYLGDIRHDSITEIALSEKFRTFAQNVKRLSDQCAGCEAFECCKGGCVHRRVDGRDYLCEATLTLFRRMRRFLDKEMVSTSASEESQAKDSKKENLMIVLYPDPGKCSGDLLDPDLLGGRAEMTAEGTAKSCLWMATRSGSDSMWDVSIVMGDTSEEMAKAIFAELSDNLDGFIEKLRAQRQD